ncbi:MAG: hypothetical protein ACK54F_03535 [Planctomycetia bacterium]|jgi:hypothetical protein
MEMQTHTFRPIVDGNAFDLTRYRVSIHQYSKDIVPGVMLSFGIPGADITMHSVSVDDLRKLAFMFGAMAEDMERVKEEQQNTTKQ